MRWLLRKDLAILGRSRLLVALLVLYPIAIALLLGFAISRAPSKPRVAIVDETPPGETVQVGNRRVSVSQYAQQLLTQVQPVIVPSRARAADEVKSGRVLAAVVIPPDIAARISSGTTQGELEVLYNGDALQQSIVQSQIGAALAQANLGFSETIQRAAAEAIDALLRGGNLSILGAPGGLVGLAETPATLRRVAAHLPPGRERAELERVARFAEFASQNLGVSKRVLSTVGQPIRVQSKLLHGRRTPLTDFAVVVAATFSLMFVCVLLAAGSLALEREEGTLARLVRGRVSRELLLTEKALLAAACAVVVAFALLAAVAAFVPLEWSRVGQWLLALAFGALAFGALGVAIGALAREVRAASLLAILVSLPLALLALVPSGSVASGFYDAIRGFSFAFPFRPALQALDAAVNRSAPSLGVSIAHLAGLCLLFGALARIGLRRLD